jgi:hypothetical protein
LDLYLPAGHPYLFDDQSEQLLALIEIQAVQAGQNPLGEAANALSEPIILDQLPSLGSQLVTFGG